MRLASTHSSSSSPPASPLVCGHIAGTYFVIVCCVFDGGGSSNAFGSISCYDRRNQWATVWAEEIRFGRRRTCQKLSGEVLSTRVHDGRGEGVSMMSSENLACPLAGIHLAQEASLRFVRGQQFNVVPRIVCEPCFNQPRHFPPPPHDRDREGENRLKSRGTPPAFLPSVALRVCDETMAPTTFKITLGGGKPKVHTIFGPLAPHVELRPSKREPTDAKGCKPFVGGGFGGAGGFDGMALCQASCPPFGMGWTHLRHVPVSARKGAVFVHKALTNRHFLRSTKPWLQPLGSRAAELGARQVERLRPVT
jgi:hypothetical protein